MTSEAPLHEALDLMVHDEGGGMLKFKGIVGNQVVEYAALLDDTRTVIIGSFLSRWPDDYGHFCLNQ